MVLPEILHSLNKLPVVEPQLTQLLVEQVQAEAAAAGPKAQAYDTPFRHSDAGSCSRRLSFKALGVPESDPFDPASTWVAWVGTMLHEHWQAAVQKSFPQAEIEPRVTSDIASGHLDLLLKIPGQTICFELKTVNGFKYANAVGVDKSHYRRKDPGGPDEKHIVQCALNALAADADLMVIGYLAMESISKKCAEVCGFSEYERILSEWTYTRDEFEPIARAEQARMWAIKAAADQGILAPALVYEKGQYIDLDPNASRTYWACDYCSHFSICKNYPVGSLDFEEYHAVEKIF